MAMWARLSDAYRPALGNEMEGDGGGMLMRCQRYVSRQGSGSDPVRCVSVQYCLNWLANRMNEGDVQYEGYSTRVLYYSILYHGYRTLVCRMSEFG